ncbi:hypothetical protein BGZ94_002243 [Podila epigama]|nr:hypothetical protein BGZ94_002243 [Podila epigama]
MFPLHLHHLNDQLRQVAARAQFLVQGQDKHQDKDQERGQDQGQDKGRDWELDHQDLAMCNHPYQDLDQRR